MENETIMKTILLIVLLLVVVAFGVYAVQRVPTAQNETSTVGKAQGVVTMVNTEQIAFDGPTLVTIRTDVGERVIAVPSMGLPLCAAYKQIADVYTLAVGDRVTVNGSINEEGQIVPCEDPTHYLIAYGTMLDATYGYSFEYKKGPDGYVTIEDNQSEDPDFVTGLLLFNKNEYEEFAQATEPREGPPSISLRVYQDSEQLAPLAWAKQHPRESNIELANREPMEDVVGGSKAIRYTADGLYPMDILVVANGKHVYMLSVAYPDGEAPIYSDFLQLVSSFTFISQ